MMKILIQKFNSPLMIAISIAVFIHLIFAGILFINYKKPLVTIGLKSFEYKHAQTSTDNNDVSDIVQPIEENTDQTQKGTNQNNSTMPQNINHPSLTFIKYEAPTYPKLARQKKMEGIVKIAIHFNQSGHVEKFELTQSSGFDILDQSAIKSIKNWAIDSKQPLTIHRAIPFKLKK